MSRPPPELCSGCRLVVVGDGAVDEPVEGGSAVEELLVDVCVATDLPVAPLVVAVGDRVSAGSRGIAGGYDVAV